MSVISLSTRAIGVVGCTGETYFCNSDTCEHLIVGVFSSGYYPVDLLDLRLKLEEVSKEIQPPRST